MKFSSAPAMEWMALCVGFLFAGRYPKVMMVCLALISLMGLTYWIKGYRRMGTGADIPVTKIASAAQGRVGLRGKVRAGKELLYTPISSRPCVWYSYSEKVTRSRRLNGVWYFLLPAITSALKIEPFVTDGPTRDESESYFYLEDSSGQCLINPRQGEFSVVEREVTTEGNVTHIERWLPESALVTVFGDFRTLDSGAAALNRETRDVIQRWRDNWSDLLVRFDTNKDGTLDQAEWEKVRQEATKEARKSIDIPRHTVSATDNQPLYLFAGRSREMNRSYSWWTSSQFMVFISSLIALATVPWWLPAVSTLSIWARRIFF